jgi:hypothetical protein
MNTDLLLIIVIILTVGFNIANDLKIGRLERKLELFDIEILKIREQFSDKKEPQFPEPNIYKSPIFDHEKVKESIEKDKEFDSKYFGR